MPHRYFLYKENNFGRFDARLKLLGFLAFLLFVMLSARILTGVVIFSAALILLFIMKVPLKLIALRMAGPLAFCLFLLCVKFFTTASIQNYLLIMSKVWASAGLMLLLSVTTAPNQIFQACLWLKLPKIFVEISLLAYRYIFVLLEEAIAIIHAQQVRLGYRNWRRSIYSIGVLTGTLVIRSYDQSIAAYESMVLRGLESKKGK